MPLRPVRPRKFMSWKSLSSHTLLSKMAWQNHVKSETASESEKWTDDWWPQSPVWYSVVSASTSQRFHPLCTLLVSFIQTDFTSYWRDYASQGTASGKKLKRATVWQFSNWQWWEKWVLVVALRPTFNHSIYKLWATKFKSANAVNLSIFNLCPRGS